MNKIKINSRPDNQYRTPEQWTEYFKGRPDRQIIVPDIKKLSDQDIDSLKKDYKERWLIFGSRIEYDKNNLSGKVIHNTGRSEIVIKVNEISDYTDTPIIKVLETKAGLDYVRALINDKKADKEKITHLFEKISGKPADKIRFWTPSQSDRANKPVRSVGFLYDGFVDGFIVNGYGWNLEGLSRGVSVVGKNFFSGSATIIKSNKAVFDFENKKITIPFSKKLRDEIKRRKKKKIVWQFKVK